MNKARVAVQFHSSHRTAGRNQNSGASAAFADDLPSRQPSATNGVSLVSLPLFPTAYWARLRTFPRRHRHSSNKGRSMAEKLDLNTASTVHLREIKGLGPSRAEEIVRYRGKHGPFTSLDDLDRVPHVGDMPPQELAKLKQQVTIAASGEAKNTQKADVNET
jgi:competence ComEA-like helix-hairpin-helix protein